MKEASTCRRVLIYIISALNVLFYIGILGVVSRLKKPMEEELGLSSTYLGIIDGLKFVALGLGCIILLFYPPKHPKRDYILSSLLMVGMFALVGASTFIPHYSEPIIMIAMFCSGFLRAHSMTPVLIVNQYFDSKGKDNKLIAIWASFTSLGSGFAVLFCEFLLQHLKLNWSTCILIFSGLFLLPIVFLSFLADEVIMIQQQQEETDINLSAFDKTKQFFKTYYGKPSNIFHPFQYSWNFQIYYSMELWIPYYFLNLGFKFNASLIAVAYSVSSCFSTPLFEFLVMPFESYLQFIIMAMFILNIVTIFGISELEQSISSFPLYLGLSVLSSFLLSSPRSRVYSQEIKERARRGNKQLFMVLLTMSFLSSNQIGIDMAIIGYVMEIQLKNYIYVVLALSVIAAANQICRQFVWGQDYDLTKNQNQENNQNQLNIEE